MDGRSRSPGRGGWLEIPDEGVRDRSRKDWHVRRQLWRIHDVDGAVHRTEVLRRGCGAASCDRLGALQSRLYGAHSQFPGAGHAVVSPVVTDLLRRQARGSAPYLAWDCLLYTSDAADERSSVDLGGRRI